MLGVAILEALPGLFTVLLIVLITRFVTRIVQLLFLAIEDGRITPAVGCTRRRRSRPASS